MSLAQKLQSQSSNGTVTAALKYGDADLSSKRRKQTEEDEQSQQQQPKNHDENISAVDEYCSFEKIISENSLHSSSFQEQPTEQSPVRFDRDLDFKGGLLASSPIISPATTPQRLGAAGSESAKSQLTITARPSSTSKGFENTFKLLQCQVDNHNERTIRVMQSIGTDCSYISLANSTKGCDNDSAENDDDGEGAAFSRLDLELQAVQRMQNLLAGFKSETQVTHKHDDRCENITTPLLSLLYDFASRGFPTDNSTDDEGAGGDHLTTLVHEKVGISSDILYHAAKKDGKKCLRIVRSLLLNKVLCGNRVSQMTRAYDDIEAVTRLLEEKEKDLELTVQIGKELLTQNNALENRVTELESDLKNSNDDRAQLVHELHKKNELIAVLTNDSDDCSENDTPTFSKSITLDLLQKKITSLQDENKSLKMEASQLANETDAVEAHERQLMEDISCQLNEANDRFDGLSLELERQREENRLQHEQIVSLTARLAEAEMRLHQLTHDNDEHVTLLTITKENQNSLALELVEFKKRYQEVLALLQEAQEQLRKQRKKTMPQARSSFISNMNLLPPDSLQSELMESSLYSENSLDSGIAGETQRMNDRIGRLMAQMPGGVAAGTDALAGTMGGVAGAALHAVPPYKRVFETVRCAAKTANFADSGNVSMTQIGAMSMSSLSGPRMSAGPAGSYYRYENNTMGVKTLSCESLASQSEENYPSQPLGVPGAPGAKDLEAALKRLTPAEVLARRAMLSYAPAGTYNYDEQPQTHAQTHPLGIRTPDSIMSVGSSGISSTTNISSTLHQWRLPEKLQIVKPIEGSQTLHHWSRLATPTLSGLLEERPGVTIRGGRGLDDLGMQLYNLSDVEEDVSEDLPGKQFGAPGCTYTYTTSMVMHPDDGIVNDLSFLSQSQMSSRMASNSTSRQPSCPATPRAGLSRKNSCSTFSVNLGLASMLNERGIKAVTPSALNTPAGPNFTPTVTPCNSPEGSPTRSMSPEPLFGLLSSGADLIRRKLVGGDIERPNRNKSKQQKVMLTRLERRALRSLKLVEKVESIGLENIIATQPNPMSQLACGIANRNSSPIAQLTSLRHIHTNANSVVDDLHFNRDQIKDVLHKGLKTPTEAAGCSSVMSSSSTSAYSSDSDASLISELNKVIDDSVCAIEICESSSTFVSPAQSTTSTTQLQKQQQQQQQSHYTTDSRMKQMQRQKSRRNLKNGIASQRPDLGRVRPDLGKVSAVNNERSTPITKKSDGCDEKTSETPHETQSLTQSFVGSVSSLLFGRKGGWL